MAIKALVKPYVMKNATFTVAADEYTAHVSEVRFTPSTQTATWRGIGGNVVKDQSNAEWSCVTGIIQDTDAQGLHQYLIDNEGQTKTVTFVPVTGGPSVTAVIVIGAPEIGGTADAFATASVTHPVVGKPAITRPGSAPILTGATPSGAAAGAQVSITGSGFTGASGAAAVKFAAVNAASYVVVSDGLIVAVVPAGAAGAAAITVTTPSGTSTALPYTRA